MSSNAITNVAEPTNASDVSTKNYSDTHLATMVITPIPTYTPFSGNVTIDAGIAATPTVRHYVNGLLVN
jgi:hypothetical protein